jgi:hypothetical protein
VARETCKMRREGVKKRGIYKKKVTAAEKKQ